MGNSGETVDSHVQRHCPALIDYDKKHNIYDVTYKVIEEINIGNPDWTAIPVTFQSVEDLEFVGTGETIKHEATAVILELTLRRAAQPEARDSYHAAVTGGSEAFSKWLLDSLVEDTDNAEIRTLVYERRENRLKELIGSPYE